MKFRYMDPNDIISVVVVMIVLAIGIYAFFTTTNAIPTTTPAHASTTLQNQTYYANKNVSILAGTVFNILGIVITIGAIMSIIGVIYAYITPRY